MPWERLAAQKQVIEVLSEMRLALIASHKKSPSTSELLIVTKKEQLWPSLLKGHALPPVSEVSEIVCFLNPTLKGLDLN